MAMTMVITMTVMRALMRVDSDDSDHVGDDSQGGDDAEDDDDAERRFTNLITGVTPRSEAIRDADL